MGAIPFELKREYLDTLVKGGKVELELGGLRFELSSPPTDREKVVEFSAAMRPGASVAVEGGSQASPPPPGA